MERPIKYWYFYYAGFILILVLLINYYREVLTSRNQDPIYLMAAIFAVSAGAALTITILAEATGAMVLLIPKIKAAIEAQGVAKGINLGKAEGIAEANQAARDWQQRKDAAEQAGRPFDEPPPWSF